MFRCRVEAFIVLTPFRNRRVTRKFHGNRRIITSQLYTGTCAAFTRSEVRVVRMGLRAHSEMDRSYLAGMTGNRSRAKRRLFAASS